MIEMDIPQLRAMTGRRVYEVRRMAGLTLPQVASFYGSSHQYMHRIESGKHAVNTATLRRLICVYSKFVDGLTSDWMLGLSTKPPRVKSARLRRAACRPTA